jgi:hypothetical protein
VRATGAILAVAALLATTDARGQERPGAARDTTQKQVVAPRRDTARVLNEATDTIAFGARTIPSGRTESGPIVVAAGDLIVRGIIDGDAITIGGDIVVESGGRVTGDAIAVLGTVRREGGAIQGESHTFGATMGGRLRSLGPEIEQASAPAAPRGTIDAIKLAVGWLIVLLLIGLGVLVFAAGYLDGVADALEGSFWRSFWVGLAGELAIAPVFVLIVLALAITVIGVLLIPFAAVAYVLAVAGLGTLGFIGVARLTGASIATGSSRALHARGSALRAVVVGVSLYMGLWIVAAAFQWSGVVSGLLRALALAVTFVAATAGLGAAIISRGGTRRDVGKREPVKEADVASWQTPTPVTGVVAARRPTPAGSSRAGR